MELVEGVPLSQALAGADEPLAISYLIQAARALAFIHSRGLLHRDLKPANLLVRADGLLKVVDFGLASGPEAAARAAAGTLLYLPPEVIEGLAPDPRSDLYSLGIAFYHALTGALPFDAPDSSSLLRQIIEGAFPPADGPPLPELAGRAIVRLGARRPEDRFQTATDLVRHLDLAAGGGLPLETAETERSYLIAPAMVGREQEARRIAEALSALSGESTAEESPSLLLVGGEAGIGKSRLIAELRRQAALAGIETILVQCPESGATPLAPFATVLRALDPSSAPSRRGRGRAHARIAALLPRAEVAGEDAEAPERRMAREKSRVLDRLTGFLLDASAETPLVIVLEDIHWADGPTLEMLGYLGRNARGTRLMIVASHRAESEVSPEFSSWLSSIARKEWCERLLLERLGEEDVRRLLALLFEGAALDGGLVTALTRESGGNPLFLLEILRTLQGENTLARTEAGWRLPEPEELRSSIPGDLEGALARRLGRVSAPEGAILGALAVMGRPLGPETAAELAAIPAGDAPGILEALAGRGLLARGVLAGGRYAFEHGLVRRAAEERLEAGQRRALHLRAAAAARARRARFPGRHRGDRPPLRRQRSRRPGLALRGKGRRSRPGAPRGERRCEALRGRALLDRSRGHGPPRLAAAEGRQRAARRGRSRAGPRAFRGAARGCERRGRGPAARPRPREAGNGPRVPEDRRRGSLPRQRGARPVPRAGRPRGRGARPSQPRDPPREAEPLRRGAPAAPRGPPGPREAGRRGGHGRRAQQRGARRVLPRPLRGGRGSPRERVRARPLGRLPLPDGRRAPQPGDRPPQPGTARGRAAQRPRGARDLRGDRASPGLRALGDQRRALQPLLRPVRGGPGDVPARARGGRPRGGHEPRGVRPRVRGRPAAVPRPAAHGDRPAGRSDPGRDARRGRAPAGLRDGGPRAGAPRCGADTRSARQGPGRARDRRKDSLPPSHRASARGDRGRRAGRRAAGRGRGAGPRASRPRLPRPPARGDGGRGEPRPRGRPRRARRTRGARARRCARRGRRSHRARSPRSPRSRTGSRRGSPGWRGTPPPPGRSNGAPRRRARGPRRRSPTRPCADRSRARSPSNGRRKRRRRARAALRGRAPCRPCARSTRSPASSARARPSTRSSTACSTSPSRRSARPAG